MVGEATAGGEHTLYKSKDGALASTGACGLGWCRLLSLNPSLFRFRAVPLPEHASLVHASYYHNLAVGRTSGSLYSWGCGTFTEGGLDGVIPALGQGRNAEDIGGLPKVVDIPMKSGEFIKDITGGAYHSAVLMNTGRIATFLHCSERASKCLQDQDRDMPIKLRGWIDIKVFFRHLTKHVYQTMVE